MKPPRLSLIDDSGKQGDNSLRMILVVVACLLSGQFQEPLPLVAKQRPSIRTSTPS